LVSIVYSLTTFVSVNIELLTCWTSLAGPIVIVEVVVDWTALTA